MNDKKGHNIVNNNSFAYQPDGLPVLSEIQSLVISQGLKKASENIQPIS